MGTLPIGNNAGVALSGSATGVVTLPGFSTIVGGDCCRGFFTCLPILHSLPSDGSDMFDEYIIAPAAMIATTPMITKNIARSFWFVLRFTMFTSSQ